MEPRTILFVCSFNSVRSQMAEALINARCPARYRASSAGIAPAGLNPYAVTVMKEIGIDISGQRSKKLSGFSGVSFEYVITLCDRARSAAAGSLPPGKNLLHHAFESPSEARKNKAEILADFRTLRDEIREWLDETFPDCAEEDCGRDASVLPAVLPRPEGSRS
jgi:arsenate reductase